MKYVVGAVVMLVVLALAGWIYLATGSYNVAATEPDAPAVAFFLGTVMENSVRSRAEELEPPPADSALLAEGLHHFHEMCVTCHGAPGIDRGEIGQGMTPTPPELSDEAAEWTAGELFWIVKNGIKLAGMPGFGPTHSDEQLWGIVQVVRALPETTPEEYAARVAAMGGDTTGGGHTHAPGTPAHEH